MYPSFFDEMQKIAKAVEEQPKKKSNFKRNLAIGGTLAGAALLGAGAYAMRRSGRAAKAAKKAAQTASKSPPKTPPRTPPVSPPPSSKADSKLDQWKKNVDDVIEANREYQAAGGPNARGIGAKWDKFKNAANRALGKDNTLVKVNHDKHLKFKADDIAKGGRP